MSSAKDFLAGLGAGSTFAEQVEAIKAEHGGQASHVLAAMLGKSLRQAQRYLKGAAQPGRNTNAAGRQRLQNAGDRAKAARRIREIRHVNPGVIDVESLSSGKADGSRRPAVPGSWLDVAGGMGAVADAYEAGRDGDAADLFDQSVIAVYGGESASDHGGIASQIGITDYQDGISYE